MKIAIIGAGFTGLAAGLRLAQKGHQVVIYERESSAGGLAIGFKYKTWRWSLEKAYHHWFTNDWSVLNLAKELNHKVIIKRPRTDIFIKGRILPLDSAVSLLKFPYISFFSRIRTGLALAFLKFTNNYKPFEDQKALEWIKKYMGQEALEYIWEPLFIGKFGKYRQLVILSWFWARIKKRTPSLAYPEGGFKEFAERVLSEVMKYGGEVNFNTSVESIDSNSKETSLTIQGKKIKFDKIISTSPTPIFLKLAKLPPSYSSRLSSIKHLHALNLILVSKKPFFKDTYWLSIADKSFPFLVLVEHTHFMDKKFFNNENILYIGCYLPMDHKYLKMDTTELMKQFDPYLKQINKDYKNNLKRIEKFVGPFAQPIMEKGYADLIPKMETPLKNVYLANLDMVYPWDRGTNYAVELGEKVAELIG